MFWPIKKQKKTFGQVCSYEKKNLEKLINIHQSKTNIYLCEYIHYVYLKYILVKLKLTKQLIAGGPGINTV